MILLVGLSQDMTGSISFPALNITLTRCDFGGERARSEQLDPQLE